jgi:hypothetical protein
MSRDELIERWAAHASDLEALGAQVDGARLIRRLLGELEQVLRYEESEVLTLAEAAEYSGFSEDHLGRLIRSKKIPNLGRRHRPRVRRGDVPRKPHALRHEPPSPFLTTSRRQIAESVVNSETEEPR